MLVEPKTMWQSYIQVSRLLEHLPAHTAMVVSKVMGAGVTREVLTLAQQSPRDEWERYQVLRILGNGNPERLDSLTEMAMDEIRIGVETGDLP